MSLTLIDENKLPNTQYISYSPELTTWMKEQDIKININTGRGQAIAIMDNFKGNYFTRKECERFFSNINRSSADAIQCFNKIDQWGIKRMSGLGRGKYAIKYPYERSFKKDMRKDFKFDGTEEEKNKQINLIKQNIKQDYVDVPNEKWELGHKNPGNGNSSSENLVLQPPIQGKYRDNYIFIDTLTKFPTPKKLGLLLKNKKIQLSRKQKEDYIDILRQLL